MYRTTGRNPDSLLDFGHELAHFCCCAFLPKTVLSCNNAISSSRSGLRTATSSGDKSLDRSTSPQNCIAFTHLRASETHHDEKFSLSLVGGFHRYVPDMIGRRRGPNATFFERQT